MNSRIKMAVAVAVMLTAGSVLVLVLNQDDSPENTTASGVGAVVWLDWNGAEPVEVADANTVNYTGKGNTMVEMIKDALSDYDVVFNSNGSIRSVNDVSNDGDHSWVVFKYASPQGWAAFQDRAENYIEGMNLAVSYADRGVVDGNVIYTPSESLKNERIEYTMYFFVQFKELNASTETEFTQWILDDGILTRAEMVHGVWISGVGINNNDALANALLNTFFPGYEERGWVDRYEDDDSVEYKIYSERLNQLRDGFFKYGKKEASYGWFLSLFGFEDTDVGSNEWTYFSQYSYHPDAGTLDDPEQWSYNQLSFGLYDITEYRYFALVLQTTGSSEDDDYFIPIPTPSTIPDGL